jgi:hypothetical protein
MGRRQAVTTVTTPATSYALVDLATVKSDFGVTIKTDDVYLTRLIARASTAISNFCNRVFAVETVSDAFSPWRGPADGMLYSSNPVLQLSRWPVISLVSVVENGATLTRDVDFTLDAKASQLIRIDSDGRPCAWRDAPIAVAYSAGFAVIPDDLIEACEMHVLSRYKARGRDLTVRSQTLTGVFQAQYWGDPAKGAMNVMDMLAPTLLNYRVPVVG